MSHPTDEIPDAGHEPPRPRGGRPTPPPDAVECAGGRRRGRRAEPRTAAPTPSLRRRRRRGRRAPRTRPARRRRRPGRRRRAAAELVWYVLKVQSSREDTIRDALERRVKIQGLQRYFGRIVVPTEKITEIRNNKKRIVERKTYPGYIMVEMELNEKTWFTVRETPGVGDFVGAHGTPTKMTEDEVNQMLDQRQRPRPRSPPRSGSTSSAATGSRSRTARSRTSRGPSRRSSRPAAWSRSC